ncbi:hypothetical protein VKT23_012102 [Stygiomarasmius scandens]|uniref:Uncharacterized protein n=1 Tax=Marasmiellus scandens TaxID=2682957 RepID=A0ABR1J7X8_9AGAR
MIRVKAVRRVLVSEGRALLRERGSNSLPCTIESWTQSYAILRYSPLVIGVATILNIFLLIFLLQPASFYQRIQRPRARAAQCIHRLRQAVLQAVNSYLRAHHQLSSPRLKRLIFTTTEGVSTVGLSQTQLPGVPSFGRESFTSDSRGMLSRKFAYSPIPFTP